MKKGEVGFRIVRDIQRVPSELVKKFAGFSTAQISDVMSRFGAMDKEIKPCCSGLKMMGIAFTVRVNPGDNLMLHKAVLMAKRGDVIVKVNDKEVNSPEELQDKIRSIEIGEKANVEVVRDGKKISFVVKIGEMPTLEEEGEYPKEKVFSVQTGLKVEAVTSEVAKELELPRVKGLVITEVIPGSSADDMGLQPGDLILEANRIEVSSVDEWEELINILEPGDTLLLLLFRGGRTYYVPIKVVKID